MGLIIQIIPNVKICNPERVSFFKGGGAKRRRVFLTMHHSVVLAEEFWKIIRYFANAQYDHVLTKLVCKLVYKSLINLLVKKKSSC